MKIYAIRVLVDDWPAACDFYENKLKLPLEFKDDGFGWAEFDVGGAKIGVERVDELASQEDKDLVGRFVGASLQVKDTKATYKELSDRGVEFVAPPEQQEWGGVLAHFKDTCGNILTLMSEA